MRIVYTGSLSEGECAGCYFHRLVPFQVPDAIGAQLLAQQPEDYQIVEEPIAPLQPAFLPRIVLKVESGEATAEMTEGDPPGGTE